MRINNYKSLALHLPAANHYLIHCSGTAWWWGQAVVVLNSLQSIPVSQIVERLQSHRPDLKQDHSKAPHITGCRIGPVHQSLRSHPLHWKSTCSSGGVHRLIHQITCHTKVTNLQPQNDLYMSDKHLYLYIALCKNRSSIYDIHILCI